MPLLDFTAIAEQLPDSWKSTRLGQVGPARVRCCAWMSRPMKKKPTTTTKGCW